MLLACLGESRALAQELDTIWKADFYKQLADASSPMK